MDSQKQLIIITTHQTTLPKDTTYKTEYNYENGGLFSSKSGLNGEVSASKPYTIGKVFESTF